MNHFARATKRARVVYQRHESRIVMIVAVCSIAVVSFVMGMMTQSAQTTAPLVLDCRADDVKTLRTPSFDVAQSADGSTGITKDVVAVPETCMYVGSKNSTKYYPPTCSFAKRIAPENLRCFTSDNDARAKGYVRSTGC